MSDNIEEKVNTSEEAVYQIGEGKNALTLQVRTHKDFFIDNVDSDSYIYMDMDLIRESKDNPSGKTIFAIGTFYNLSYYDLPKKELRKRMSKDLAEKLLKSKSIKAGRIKGFLEQIKGNPLIDEIKEQMKVVEMELNNNKLARVRARLAEKIDRKLGTHLEKAELPTPLKKVEKAISDTILGKVRE